MPGIAEMLGKVDLFAGLPREVIDELVSRGSTMSWAAGHAVVTQGAEDAGFQLLVDGTARVLVHDQEKATLGQGDYFGEMSLLDGRPRSATIVAGEGGTKTFALSPLSFAAVLDANPAASRVLLATLTGRLRALEEKRAQEQ